MKKLLAILLSVVAVSATAQEVTGAGATFPAPLYSKSTISQLVQVQASNRLKPRQSRLVQVICHSQMTD
jgi:hypothetical protein